MPDEPVAHLPRPVPPWEEIRHTHCGRLIVDVAKMGTSEAYTATVKKYGQRRAAFDYCVTCCQRASVSGASWETSAVEITSDWVGRGIFTANKAREDVRASLHALAALVEAHRDEFEAHRDATKSGAVSLSAKRADKGRRQLRGLT